MQPRQSSARMCEYSRIPPFRKSCKTIGPDGLVETTNMLREIPRCGRLMCDRYHFPYFLVEKCCHRESPVLILRTPAWRQAEACPVMSLLRRIIGPVWPTNELFLRRQRAPLPAGKLSAVHKRISRRDPDLPLLSNNRSITSKAQRLEEFRFSLCVSNGQRQRHPKLVIICARRQGINPVFPRDLRTQQLIKNCVFDSLTLELRLRMGS